MKTVAEFAKEMDVSVQTIYRRLNKVKQFNDEGLTVKRDGITYITVLGEEALTGLTDVKHQKSDLYSRSIQSDITEFNGVKQASVNGFNSVKRPVTSEFNDVKQSVKQQENADIAYFKEQNRILQEELIKEREHSRTQADRLANLAEQLAELSRNNQILLGAEQSRTNPALLSTGEQQPDAEEQPIKKKGFWGLFKKQ